MMRCLPDQIGSLVEVGLETGEEVDRLIALGAANVADNAWTPETRFGAQVVEIFMDQFNLGFKRPTKSIDNPGWGDHETIRDSQIIREVSKAVGSELEVKTTMYEFLGSAGANESFVLVEDKIETIDKLFTDNKPIFVKHDYGNDTSRANFRVAVGAVQAFQGDTSCSGTIEQIRGLKEV